jgi:hypothetical protein
LSSFNSTNLNAKTYEYQRDRKIQRGSPVAYVVNKNEITKALGCNGISATPFSNKVL